MSESTKQVYVPPTEIPWTAEEEAFVAACSPKERRLIELAKKSLGTSFFLKWTHLFAQRAKKTPAP